MLITKIATKKDVASRQWKYTNSARDAWSKILDILKKENPNSNVLLPSYIGWSPNEGSGIFDSVKSSGLSFDFYNLNKNLAIDVKHLKSKVSENDNCIVLIVHYFGFPDIAYNEIVNWLNQHKVLFIEDCAHSWLTDLIGGKCGRKGRYAFYSLHKMLPVVKGGLLVDNFPMNANNENDSRQPYFDLGYDLFTIYEKRRSNYKYMVNELLSFSNIEVMYIDLEDGVCPQTLPVIINNFDRDRLYKEMNDLKIGMVSLYHTMIEELHNSTSEAAYFTSKHIINFPIHQDIGAVDIDNLIIKLKLVLDA